MASDYFKSNGSEMNRANWSLEDYLEEIIHLNEISEYENVDKRISELKREMKIRFPKKSKKTMGFIQ